MALLVAEVGGTKSAWYYRPSPEREVNSCTLSGYHPLWESPKKLTEELLPAVWQELAIKDQVEVAYYGTGVIGEASISQLQQDLLSSPFIRKASVASDIEAACIATSFNQAGIVCILGTGTNSAVYDGHMIIDKIPSLGIIAGDEGSGGGLGKLIFQAWAYRSLEDSIAQLLEQYTQCKFEQYRQDFLKSKSPGQFLAHLAPFALTYGSHLAIKQLIDANFKAFVEKILLKYPSIRSCPIHFVGSFAWFFQEHLKEVLSVYDLTVGNIIESPGHKLFDILEKNKD